MDDENFKGLKKVAGVVIKTAAVPIIIIAVIVVIVIIVLASSVYVVKKDDGTYKEDDWANTQFVVRQSANNATISDDGKINGSMSAQEMWDKLLEEGGNVEQYLSGPSSLKKLMDAELITQYMDTRPNPDEPIDWDAINKDVDSTEIQGIIKAKRALPDGTKVTMSYVSPEEFQSYIDEYNSTGSEAARQAAITHFTLVQTTTGGGTSGGQAAGDVSGEVLTTDGKITVYNGDGSAMEGGKYNSFGQILEDGMCAVKDGYIPGHSVIYIQTTSEGEGSHANGRYYYVCDTGGGLEDGQVDIYANVTQEQMNAAPYGTYNGAKITLVEEGVSWEDYQTKYYNSTTTPTQQEDDEDEDDDTQSDEETVQTKYVMKVATWTETEDKQESTDPNVASYDNFTYNMTTTLVDYQNAVKGYTMPFDYLWDFIVLTEDEEFALDIADLVQNSQIEITVFDNLSINTSVVERHYQIQQQAPHESSDAVGTVRWETVDVMTRHTTIKRQNTIDVELTRANVWIVDYSREFKYTVPEETSTTTTSGDTTITTTLQEYKYVGSPAKIVEKTDPNSEEPNFVTILKGNSHASSTIQSSTLMLFDFLSGNDTTADMIDLTKYLLYKAYNHNYGVTEFDFSVFNPGDFQVIGANSGIYGNTIQEKVWFALRAQGYSEYATAGVMGNIEAESGFNTSVIEGGSGIGAGLCQWSYERRTALENYAASKGTTWDDVNTQIEFLIAELTPGGGANGYATYQLVTYNGYSPDDWKNATSPEEAAIAFCWSFERPGVPRMDVRTEAAVKYYNAFHGRTAPTGGSAQPDTGDGYNQTFTSSSGRTYREYKQFLGSYADKNYEYFGETMSSSGCSITAVAVITSGYNNNQTPETLRTVASPYMPNLLNQGGAQCSGYQAPNRAKLTSGKPALVQISGTLVTERGSKYYGGHFIAILDARNGNEVYVSDVGASDAKSGGWTNVDNIMNIAKQVAYVENE